MTQHAEIQDRLNDFVDGALPAEERGAVLDHLEECPACRDELEGLLALQAATRALPREIAPPRDLWLGIAARLRQRVPGTDEADAPSRQVIAVDFRAAAPRPAWRRWAPLAAAAVVLMALSSGVTAFLMGDGAAPVATAPVGTAPAERPATALAAFRPTELEYLGTVETLQAALEERRDRLAPQTVATIEENLRIIDRAIGEARAALVQDPGNADLPLLLSGVYRKKVELLQSALQLPARSI